MTGQVFEPPRAEGAEGEGQVDSQEWAPARVRGPVAPGWSPPVQTTSRWHEVNGSGVPNRLWAMVAAGVVGLAIFTGLANSVNQSEDVAWGVGTEVEEIDGVWTFPDGTVVEDFEEWEAGAEEWESAFNVESGMELEQGVDVPTRDAITWRIENPGGIERTYTVLHDGMTVRTFSSSDDVVTTEFWEDGQWSIEYEGAGDGDCTVYVDSVAVARLVDPVDAGHACLLDTDWLP